MVAGPRAGRTRLRAWRGLLVLLAGATVALAPAPVAQAFEPRVPESWFGIADPDLSVLARDQDPRLAVHADAIRNSGLGFVRSTIDWRQVEPVLGIGGLHVYSWGATDRLVRALATRGLELVPSVVGTPAWARASDALTCSSENLAAIAEVHAPAYGDLVGAVVSRYGPAGSYWAANPGVPRVPVRRVEIWNEPNWTGFWCPRPQPERFATAAFEAARAARAADPRVATALGGLVALKEHEYFGDGRMRGMEAGTFLSRMTASEPRLPDLLDEVALHPYDPDPDVNISLLGWFRARLAQAGLADVGILVSETGWSTRGSASSLDESARAAAYDDLMTQLPRTDCDVTAVAPHAWHTPETDPADPEHWYGIADPATGVPHPSGDAYLDAVALFEGRGSTPAPRETIPVCGGPAPDQDGDGTPDEADDYPLDPARSTGSGEVPPTEPEPEPPARPPSVERSFFGATNLVMPDRAQERLQHYDSMAAVGLPGVRQGVEWANVEPTGGATGVQRFRWSDLDRRAIALANRGISISLATLRAPAWVPRSPSDADGRFAEFLAAVAGRYGSDGEFWAENRHLDPRLAPRDFEVWAAANLDSSAWDGSASPGEYAATYAAARAALRAADPGARAIVHLSSGGTGAKAAGFLSGMVADRPSLAGGIDGVYVEALGARSPAAIDELVARVRDALEATGNPGARLRIGFGASTAGSDALSESERATFVADVAARLPRLDCGVDQAVLYSWTSLQADPTSQWDWFGVARLSDGAPLPAAMSFTDVARVFSGFGPTGPERTALHPCVREPLDRDGDGTPDAADPAPLDPQRSQPLASPPPAPEIVTAPPAWSNQTTASFVHDAPDAVSYHCRIDAAEWHACGARRQVSGLADGPHWFSVRAVDALGLVGAASAHRWEVDTRPPQTLILAAPDSIVAGERARFKLGSDEAGVRYICRLDEGAWQFCDANVSYRKLDAGLHEFEAVAVDRAGNGDPDAERHLFEVREQDRTAPKLKVKQRRISGRDRTPTVRFRARDESGPVRTKCRVDRSRWRRCRSPYTAPRLKPGRHRLHIKAIDAYGNSARRAVRIRIRR